MNPPELKPATLAAQARHYLDPATGGLVPPLQPSTTFARDAGYALINPAHSYGRDDNPGYAQRIREDFSFRSSEARCLSFIVGQDRESKRRNRQFYGETLT